MTHPFPEALVYLADPLVALDYIVDDEEALLRVLSGNGAQVRPVEERSHERT